MPAPARTTSVADTVTSVSSSPAQPKRGTLPLCGEARALLGHSRQPAGRASYQPLNGVWGDHRRSIGLQALTVGLARVPRSRSRRAAVRTGRSASLAAPRDPFEGR
jgi:hypothetical protein